MKVPGLEDLIELYSHYEGSYVEIARHVGCSRERIRQIFSKVEGYPPVKKAYLKSSRERTEEVKRLAESNHTAKEISIILGWSQSLILGIARKHGFPIVNGRSRKDLLPDALIKLYDDCKGNYSAMAREIDVKPGYISQKVKDLGLRDRCPALHIKRKIESPKDCPREN